MPKRPPTSMFTVRLPRELHRRLKAVSKASGATMSTLAATGIVMILNRYERSDSDAALDELARETEALGLTSPRSPDVT